ncbi:hypothetical protein NHX12_005066 [Muraenolepis orangiensis]|uniref:Uncharacterized protein n=1 Tax=Muraenolepis orangiensis TaxID=630683 RepID=A0A9Q0DWR2_9TELE|nr:hypothetical protein NHX12_005066 [Muraenolepis orangiensis]
MTPESAPLQPHKFYASPMIRLNRVSHSLAGREKIASGSEGLSRARRTEREEDGEGGEREEDLEGGGGGGKGDV